MESRRSNRYLTTVPFEQYLIKHCIRADLKSQYITFSHAPDRVFYDRIMEKRGKESSVSDVYIALAKAAIRTALGEADDFDLADALVQYPELQQKGAAFVTLNQKGSGRLRGCIGSLQAYRPLFEDIIDNARSAALHDPRFPPLTLEEMEKVSLEISLLSPAEPLSYTDSNDLRSKIIPGKDGVVLRYNGYRATYLPQVWEELPDFDAFFSSLCRKAGLPGECLSYHPEIDLYQVTRYEE